MGRTSRRVERTIERLHFERRRGARRHARAYDLRRLQDRVHRNEGATGRRGAERRDDRLESLLEIDGHAFLTADACLDDRIGEGLHPARQLLV